MKLLATPLGYLLTWIYDFVGSYGIAIIILTVIVKAALYPVYSKQMKSTFKMTEMSQKVKEIQQKYAKDQALMNEKVQELYKQEGVSMYGGCLPMVIQMIVIMGLFTLLRNPIAYMQSDDMLFAVHESFLWIQDLAQPDLWILPIAAGIATYISTSMSNANNMGGAGGANPASNGAMNAFMKYFFPIMILWFARSYPAGLSIYWFGSQVIQIFYNLKFNKWKKENEKEKMVNEQRKRIEQKKRQQAKAN